MKTSANRRRVSDDERLDRVFSALGDRTRRSMLARLAMGPANVSELAEPFDMTLPGASKHLRVLERAGLLKRQVDGRIHRCSLDPRRLAEARLWLKLQQRFWDETLDALVRHVQ